MLRLAAYANVLFTLGLENDIKLIARDDEPGLENSRMSAYQYEHVHHEKPN